MWFFDFLTGFFLALPQSGLPNHRGLWGTKRNILSPGMTQAAQKSHCDPRRLLRSLAGVLRRRPRPWRPGASSAQGLCRPPKSGPRCHGAQDRTVSQSVDNTPERQPRANLRWMRPRAHWAAARQQRAGRQGQGCGPRGCCTVSRGWPSSLSAGEHATSPCYGQAASPWRAG